MDRNFTFVAYKANSSDYCRGCVMERYSSAFIIKSNLTKEELIKEWAEVESYECRIGESGYEVTILAHDPVWGTEVFVYGYLELGSVKNDDDTPYYMEAEAESKDIHTKMKEKVQAIKTERENKKIAELAEQKARQARLEYENELKQLAHLKAKHERR